MKALAEEWKKRDKEREVLMNKKVKNITYYTSLIYLFNMFNRLRSHQRHVIKIMFFPHAVPGINTSPPGKTTPLIEGNNCILSSLE